MEDIIQVIAQPLWEWLQDAADVIVIAVPNFIEGLQDSAQVLVTAVPEGFAVAMPFFLFGGFIILAGYQYDYL